MLEEQLHSLLEIVPVSMLVMQDGTTIAYANGEAANLLGCTRDELVGLPFVSVVPERFRDELETRLAAARSRPVLTTTGAKVRLSVLNKSGRELPVEMHLNAIEAAGCMHVVAGIREISDRATVSEELRVALVELEELRDRLKLENLYLREEIETACGFEEFVGESSLLKLLHEMIGRVATTDSTVLILGETGTGKQLVARAVHGHSDRKDHPLITMNCAALPESLIESELFGHEAGAFTGAISRKIGRFELANGGTLFLDEIGEMPIELQAKLLRVIQEGVFWRIGANSTTRVNVRLIAATNRDLRAAIHEGRFRSDLYFRLAVFPITVPSLRARRDDIPLLVWHFIAKKQSRLGKRIDEVSQSTMDRLIEYAWPGNIRELENVIERAMILSPGSTLIVEELQVHGTPQPAVPLAASGSIDQITRAHILSVLEKCRWRTKGAGGAAEYLGMKPSTLRYRMKKLGIERP